MLESLDINGDEEPERLFQKGWLSMAFQPIFEADGTIYGYEALLRGTPRMPIGNPESLFSKRKSNGNLIRLDMACVGSALRSATRLSGESNIFINVHAETLIYLSDHCDVIESLLDELGIPPSRVVFEISERTDTSHIESLMVSLNAFCGLGIRTAIDDVGEDFKWLHEMLFLEPSFIKVDKSYIGDLAGSPQKQTLVKFLARMTDFTGIRIVAEGVEDVETLDVLHSLGVHMSQGFYLGRPMAANHWSNP